MAHPIAIGLWYDTQAKEAADFYVDVFQGARIKSETVINNTPSGDTYFVVMDILDMEFQLIGAGPLFKFNPAISFMVNFDPSRDPNAAQRIDDAWNKLAEGGTVLMPIQEYPFSKRYGWIQDKFGVSWQLILTNPDGEPRPPLMPALMFIGDNTGKAEGATDFYMSLFKDSKRGQLARYPAGMAPDEKSSVMFTDFTLSGQWFVAMDSGQMHQFNFNEAVSLIVTCDTQEEIDYFWEKLSAVAEAEQCGWLKDIYGVSWQIVPKALGEFMSSPDKNVRNRVTEAFLQMKKFDIAALTKAYEG